ncbi:MAG TPA: biotin-independent malonate decarboxylase subunit gamma [Candidatus Sulfotelmatobacter sp.]|jgi:malonate decarboxylase gamma subunit|nr:biotin-independent malonate decarboxylase subunit gamma [Candidatus Sulfotelmatobacter sp.]
MDAKSLLNRLFPQSHEIGFDGLYFCGTGQCGDQSVAVIGSVDAAPIGVELAFRMAGEVLSIVRAHPGRPILLLVDTQGQRLSHRDELLGINGYMAHLAKCIELARKNGHKVIGLVYSQAVSGGFLASSLLADECYALPEAEVKVMNLPAMSRITKIPLERLEDLSQTSPVFAPGVENYLRMGAVAALWNGDLASCLAEALAKPVQGDHRRALGETRRGRLLALPVSHRVRHAES